MLTIEDKGKLRKGIEKELHDLNGKIKSRLNELKNLYKENMCFSEFVRFKKLDEEYMEWRKHFYQMRKWK